MTATDLPIPAPGQLAYAALALLSASCALVFDYGDYRDRPGSGGAGAGGADAGGHGGELPGAGGGGAGDGGGGASSCECPPPPDTACASYSCDESGTICSVAFEPLGTAAPGDSQGPCRKNACDGGGAVIVMVDDSALPIDANDCTDDVCTDGEPTNPFRPDGSSCGAGDALACAGGVCVGCSSDDDCAATGDPCLLPHCIDPGPNGTCGTSPVDDGTFVDDRFSVDCVKRVCVRGAATSVPDDGETPPSDGNPCHESTCSGGTAMYPAVPDGTTCMGGKQCFGGTCVECSGANFSPCSLGGLGFCYQHGCEHCNDQGDCAAFGGGCCNAGACSGAPSCSDGCQDGNEGAQACAQAASQVDCGTLDCGACNNCPCATHEDCHTKFCSPAFGNLCEPCTVGGTPPCTPPATCNAATGICQ